MSPPRGLRAEIVEVARALHARGWVANHDGNVTARQDGGGFLATPTATSKARVADRTLIEVDAAGKVTAGPGKPFSELALHLAVYQRRADVRAVVHAHPPNATALAVAGSPLLERPFLAEAVVSLGPRVPTVPPTAPGEAAVLALGRLADDHDAVLLGNHGVLAWGATLELAYLRLELVEHLARIALLAQPVGGVRPLPEDVVRPLLEARARAGLGRAADRAVQLGTGSGLVGKPVVACAPAPHADVRVIPPGGERSPEPPHAAVPPIDRDRLADLVREELVRALRR